MVWPMVGGAVAACIYFPFNKFHRPEPEKQEALSILKKLPPEFEVLRAGFEEVYAHTRILNKPEGYILDQDHHRHMANQSINFDWQFWAEIYFLEKLSEEIKNL